jgi:hypothetical protein
LISFIKQLDVDALNAKGLKDHLPVEPQQKAKALEDYAAAGIRLHAAGLINFTKDEDEAFEVAYDLSYVLVKKA